MRKRITAFVLAVAAATMLMGATTAQARECIGIRGVICYSGKQCVTEPCYLNP